MDARGALAELLDRQRAVLDTLHAGANLTAGRLADAWRLCELAGQRLEAELAAAGVSAGLATDLAADLGRARALAALLEVEVAARRTSVLEELSRVRAARRRLSTLDRDTKGRGTSCDISG